MTLRKVIHHIPETYLTISVLFYWYSSTFYNLIAFVLIGITVFQLVYKNNITGLIIASLFTLINLYLVLALVSELSEFPTHNREWKTMLIVGSTYIGLNIIIGVSMFIKYINRLIKHENEKTLSELK